MSTRMLVTECFDGNHAACKGYNGPVDNPNFTCDCNCHSTTNAASNQQEDQLNIAEDAYQCDACDSIVPHSELQSGIPSAGVEGSFCAECRGESEIAAHQTAANLVAHLEAGGLIARGEPQRAEFLRFEIYGENRVKYLGSYGFGSALWSAESRLARVLKEPHEWVCIPLDIKPPNHEASANELLSALGHYVNLDWELVVQDERPVNTQHTQQEQKHGK